MGRSEINPEPMLTNSFASIGIFEETGRLNHQQ